MKTMKEFRVIFKDINGNDTYTEWYDASLISSKQDMEAFKEQADIYYPNGWKLEWR